MEYAYVALKLVKLNVGNLINFARAIVLAMTNNPNFTTPNPALADLTTAADDLEEAQALKKSLGLANRDAKKLALKRLLQKEAMYVQEISDGDAAIIESAGMPVRKTPEPQGYPGEIRDLQVRDGNSVGEIVVKHKGATGRNNDYHTQYTYDAAVTEKSWVSMEPTGKHRVLITGLTSGRRVAFRVRAMNTAGFGVWSTVAYRTVQ